jgi:CTP:molybdopterin cytidylyltransferase MocA
MGGPKALLQLDGRTLVERGVELLREGGCDPVVVVVGAAADAVTPLVTTEVVLAADWQQGVGASLRAGLAALADRPAQA